MKKSKIFVALALSACIALGTTGLAACQGTAEPGKSAYEIAVEHGFEGTEAEWLESLKGESEKGDKGDKGEKGDKGDKGEKGDKGDKGENGTNGTDGANGANGEDGAAGKDGNTWLVGTTAPTAEQGNDGDLYLDYSTWNVYHKESGAWVLLGNIKGDKGDKGDSGSQSGEVGENVIKDFGSVTISAGGTQELDLTGVEAGTYYLIAETSGEAANEILSSVTDDSVNHNGSTNFIATCDMYAPVKGEYKSAVILNEGTTLSLKNSSEAEITANVKLVELTVPTIEEGIEYDIPAINGNYGYIEIPLDESLVGKTVKITIKNSNNIVPAVLDPAKKTLGAWKTTDKQEDDSYQKEFTLTDTCTSLYFRYSFSKTNRNFIVKIEVVG